MGKRKPAQEGLLHSCTRMFLSPRHRGPKCSSDYVFPLGPCPARVAPYGNMQLLQFCAKTGRNKDENEKSRDSQPFLEAGANFGGQEFR